MVDFVHTLVVLIIGYMLVHQVIDETVDWSHVSLPYFDDMSADCQPTRAVGFGGLCDIWPLSLGTVSVGVFMWEFSFLEHWCNKVPTIAWVD